MVNNKKLLCVDTSTFYESVALMAGHSVVQERMVERRGGHGPGVLDDVADLLAQAEWTLSDLDGFACGLGPGSFTGLRIGLATVKAFSMALNKPVFGARTTSMLLTNYPEDKAVAVIDARREQVYLDAPHLKAPICCNPDEMTRYLESQIAWTFVGDGALAYRTLISQAFPKSKISDEIDTHRPHARSLTKLIDFGEPAPLATLEPIYIRKSDAEINYPDGFPDALAGRTKA